MNKFVFTLFLISTSLFSVEIPTERAKIRSFGKSVELNAKVIQLPNAKQLVMSLVSGHLEKYYVHVGQKVKAGQKIALMKSIILSKMTAEYIALKERFSALDKNYRATKSLYDKGMTSMQELNLQSIERNAMLAEITALRSQLTTLDVRSDALKKASADHVLYAHSAGTVSALLQPLHSVIADDTGIISIVKDQAFYINSFLPLEYADVIKSGQKIVVDYNGRKIITHIAQVLPELDEKTQRIVLLSSVDEKADDLYINAYLRATLYLDTNKEYVAVKKSALSFFNNEWVVFMPAEHDEEEHGEHEDEEEHGTGKEDYDEHDGEEAHEDHESPYEARVIEIIAQDEMYAAVKGIEAGEAYVSDKSYYAKSMILKSSLGEHGH